MARTEILKDDHWQIRFVRHGDRWAHTIGVVLGDRLLPLLASIEGNEVDLWPPSPPLKDFHLHDANGSTTAMLVGMAGNSHWSVTVQLADGDPAVKFDIACRIKNELPDTDDARKRVSPLSSSYRTMVCPAPESNQAATLMLDDLSIRVSSEPVAGNEDTPAAVITTGDNSLQIVALPDAAVLPRTVRWKYCVRRTDIKRQISLE
jgi:hypothetical protein